MKNAACKWNQISPTAAILQLLQIAQEKRIGALIRPFILVVALLFFTHQARAEADDFVFIRAWPAVEGSDLTTHETATIPPETTKTGYSIMLEIKLRQDDADVFVDGFTQTVDRDLGEKTFPITVPLSGKGKCTKFKTKTLDAFNVPYSKTRKICASIEKLDVTLYHLTVTTSDSESPPDTTYSDGVVVDGGDDLIEVAFSFDMKLNPDGNCKFKKLGASRVRKSGQWFLGNYGSWTSTFSAKRESGSFCVWN